jgi:hypothetical protein
MKTLVASLVALICSVGIAIAIGYYVPRVVPARAILCGIWLPWFLLPLMFPIQTLRRAALALAVPVLMAIPGGVSLEALVVFAIALALGVGAKRLVAVRKRAA